MIYSISNNFNKQAPVTRLGRDFCNFNFEFVNNTFKSYIVYNFFLLLHSVVHWGSENVSLNF